MKIGNMSLGIMFGKFLLITIIFCSAACTNLHPLPEGHWWRSAQLNEARLRQLIADEKIDTVINLRGDHPGREEFDTETRVTSELNVELYHFRMNSKRFPSRQQLLRLLELIEEKRDQRVLVHCFGGADRTSIVAFLYLSHGHHWSRQEALDAALGLKFMHISEPAWFPWAKPEIDRFCEEWRSGEHARRYYMLEPSDKSEK